MFIGEELYSEFEYFVGFQVTLPYLAKKALFFTKNISMSPSMRSVKTGNVYPDVPIKRHEHHGKRKNIAAFVEPPRTNGSKAIDPYLKLFERQYGNNQSRLKPRRYSSAPGIGGWAGLRRRQFSTTSTSMSVNMKQR
jgi:hypothetical protein